MKVAQAPGPQAWQPMPWCLRSQGSRNFYIEQYRTYSRAEPRARSANPGSGLLGEGRTALAWAQIVFSALCVVTGVVIGLTGNLALGIPVVTVATGWQITVHVRR